MASFKPEEKQRVLSALKTLTAFVESQDVSKSCQSCMHWAMGCKLAEGQMPPEQVQKEGCQSWAWDGIVF
jgi:hypothetical protein